MFQRILTIGATIGCVATLASDAGEATAPSLGELKAIVKPLLDGLGLTVQQKTQADAVMSDKTWQTILEGFEIKRGGELFHTTHDKMRELMPKIMMPKMMAYNMKKTMTERMGTKAGPLSATEIKSMQTRSKKLMRSKLAPVLMGNLEEMAEARMQEVLVDKKPLVRALGEKLSEVVLTDAQKPKFEAALTNAGYPESLIHGTDAILIERMEKMIETETDKQLAALEAKK